MGIIFLLALPDSNASQRFLINYCLGEIECTGPSFSMCTQCKITWQEVRGTTEIISCQGKNRYLPFS